MYFGVDGVGVEVLESRPWWTLTPFDNLCLPFMLRNKPEP